MLMLLLALQLAVDEDRVGVGRMGRRRVGGRRRGTGGLERARRVGPAADATVHGGDDGGTLRTRVGGGPRGPKFLAE